jgi:hypothetical protein
MLKLNPERVVEIPEQILVKKISPRVTGPVHRTSTQKPLNVKITILVFQI